MYLTLSSTLNFCLNLDLELNPYLDIDLYLDLDFELFFPDLHFDLHLGLPLFDILRQQNILSRSDLINLEYGGARSFGYIIVFVRFDPSYP